MSILLHLSTFSLKKDPNAALPGGWPGLVRRALGMCGFISKINRPSLPQPSPPPCLGPLPSHTAPARRLALPLHLQKVYGTAPSPTLGLLGSSPRGGHCQQITKYSLSAFPWILGFWDSGVPSLLLLLNYSFLPHPPPRALKLETTLGVVTPSAHFTKARQLRG